MLDAAFHGDGISHLDHGGALFGLQELYLEVNSKQNRNITILISLLNEIPPHSKPNGKDEGTLKLVSTFSGIGSFSRFCTICNKFHSRRPATTWQSAHRTGPVWGSLLALVVKLRVAKYIFPWCQNVSPGGRERKRACRVIKISS